MNAEQHMVLEFHRKFRCAIETLPTVPSEKVRALRNSLMQEEMQELLLADNLTEIADALGDLLYVVYGTAVACGIDMEPIFAEIHRSNMSKAHPDGSFTMRGDGKILKPPTYSEPNLIPIMVGQKPLGETAGGPAILSMSLPPGEDLDLDQLWFLRLIPPSQRRHWFIRAGNEFLRRYEEQGTVISVVKEPVEGEAVSDLLQPSAPGTIGGIRVEIDDESPCSFELLYRPQP